jgi:hypothetical protein
MGGDGREDAQTALQVAAPQQEAAKVATWLLWLALVAVRRVFWNE